MARRKYRFRSRQEAEDKWTQENQARLRVEWLLTAMLDKRHTVIGQCAEYEVGVVLLRHSAFVYAIRRNAGDSIHRVSGTWDVYDEKLSDIIKSQIRWGIDGDTEAYAFGSLLEKAQRVARTSVLGSPVS